MDPVLYLCHLSLQIYSILLPHSPPQEANPWGLNPQASLPSGFHLSLANGRPSRRSEGKGKLRSEYLFPELPSVQSLQVICAPQAPFPHNYSLRF